MLRGGGIGFILLLHPGWELAEKCPLSGRAWSPQEGIAARLLQAPGCVQGWVLEPPARCISGAGSSPTGRLKVENKGAQHRAGLRWC